MTVRREANAAGRIALLHALAESIEPINDAFYRLWPEVSTFNVLDDSLSRDCEQLGELSKGIYTRIESLARYAVDAGGDGMPTLGIIFTGTAFGPAVVAARQIMSVPLLMPHEAAFRMAATRARHLLLLTTFAPSSRLLNDDLAGIIASTGGNVRCEGKFVDGALQALRDGRPDVHDRLIASAASGSRADCIVLGQFSMARAAATVTAYTGVPVICTPDAVVRALQTQLTGMQTA